MIALECGFARVEIDPEAGGRIAQLRVGDLSLLVAREAANHPLGWGCYPMAPWAGRVREGRFAFRGRAVQLPLAMPPHAIHGTVLDRAWDRVGAAELAIDLGADWPFAGHARQRFELEADRLCAELEVAAEDEPFPATLGFHPWFRRRLERGGSASLDFKPRAMYERDATGIPTGALRAVPPGPWDDCFTDLARSPVILWPGALRVELSASCDHWVVYDEPAHALCVEPMTGPPDALNSGAAIVEPGRALTCRFELRWSAVAPEQS